MPNVVWLVQGKVFCAFTERPLLRRGKLGAMPGAHGALGRWSLPNSSFAHAEGPPSAAPGPFGEASGWPASLRSTSIASASPSQPEKLVTGARSLRGATVPDKPAPGSILRSSSSGPFAPLAAPVSSVAMPANVRATKDPLTSGGRRVFRHPLPRAKGTPAQGLHVSCRADHLQWGGGYPVRRT